MRVGTETTHSTKQLVLMTNASFRRAGYALMIEDNPNQKIRSKRKTYAPLAFDSKIFSLAQLNISIYSKEFLVIYMAFLEVAHILWEASKQTIVLTDNKSVTFFPNQSNPTSTLEFLWLCVTIQFQNSAHRWFSRHCGWFSLPIGSQSHREDTSQNPRRYPNNTYRRDDIFLGCRWRREIFLHTSTQWGWVRRTNSWMKRTTSTKCKTMGSKWGTTLLENKRLIPTSTSTQPFIVSLNFYLKLQFIQPRVMLKWP